MSEWMRKSPLEWQAFVNKEVKVTASEKNEFQGWVLTTDPVSANVVLVNFLADGRASVTGVTGHAVRAVEVLREGDEATRERLLALFAPKGSPAYSPGDLDRRKSRLKTWLEENGIPVSEEGDPRGSLRVAGLLTVHPPYGPEDCSGSNEIVLARVQGLLAGHVPAGP
ncbi:gem-associated protein 6 [Tachyglossus aculeatus]|uniref:gem-associated protein 6 n=1 Tax=Tachyglossus aculeatus TaxID=9261 RepID=UPI0018F66A53|nr:gem-associated protein 6 [Tachyglossus aculeatus]XP_038604345.1 gem-associated protein 6 [Tachyglossus aculeatus]XP_038604352.1 gem-associated protein 6 [Tachyglossus aculeatus]